MKASRKDVKNNILNAALEEFAEKGFRGSRMGAIAQRAGEHQALIHYYFENKEKLYVAVLNKIFALEQKKDIVVYPNTWKLTPSQKLYIAIYFMVYIQLEATDPNVYKILQWELAEGRKFLDPVLKEYIIPRQKILTQIIEEGIEKGEFTTENPNLLVFSITTFAHSYCSYKDLYLSTPLSDIIYGENSTKKLFDFIIDSSFKILKPKGKSLTIPDIPPELKKFIDSLVENVKQDKDGYLIEEIIENLNNLMVK